jgi:aminoglycoside phosphotransferase (APT) family kinase protein
MSRNIQLLKQVRNAAATINQTTNNSEYKAILTAADYLFNELMLQDSSDFYLQYIAQGKILLTEGNALAKKMDQPATALHQLRDDLTAEMRIEVINSEIDKLHLCLNAVVKALDEGRSAAEKDYLIRLSAWEKMLYDHRLVQISAASEGQAKAITLATLQAYLEKKFPSWKGIWVTNFMALDGGFSKKTILFETEDALNGKQSLVMRAEQPYNMLCYEGSDVKQEYYTIQLMRKAGLPIAEPLWLEEDASHLGVCFIVSRKATGKTYGGNFGSEQALSTELLDMMLDTFIQMHKIKLDPSDPLTQKSHLREWLPCKTVTEALHYSVTVFLPRLISLTDIPVSPQLTRGLNWLEKNIPDVPEAPNIVHLDFSFNNLIIDGNKITAVLDWESSHIGDPAEDIIWTQFSLADYISMPEFLKRYKAGTGRDVPKYRIAYARVLKCAYNALSCLSSARSFDKTDDAHINLGILGFKYMAYFGVQFNELIAEAEKVRGR